MNWQRQFHKLQQILPPGEWIREPAKMEAFAADKWFARRLPDAVVLARSAATVSKLLAFATQEKIPVTPRGAGYGYVGGCVPITGGIVLSLDRMQKIKEIHPRDFVAVVQPGVRTAVLQEAVEKLGLFYPPDPASRADCSIGGNIATNAGGPRCLKYGVTRDYILGLEVVLPDGSIARVGGRTHKNKTGFDLVGLFTGSEGLLGVVTEATLKLLPMPPYRSCLSVGFESMHRAVGAVHRIFDAGFLPSALEIADAFTLKAARKRTGSRRLEGCDAHLIVEIDGQKNSVASELRHLIRVVRSAQPRFIDRGTGPAGCEAIWKLRREFSYSLRDTGLTKLNEDVVVPRGALEELFHYAEKLQRKYKIPIACFGHAGDGNIHVNLMADMAIPEMAARCDVALDELFRQIVKMGGVITGEHGIGLAKKKWWNIAVQPPVDQLHRQIKKALDPSNILNPGKIFQ